MPHENGASVTDESEQPTFEDEPSVEDFEAAEQEPPPAGLKVAVVRILRLVGVLLVIVALLLYFVVPFNTAFRSVLHRLRLPGGWMRTIPLAPEPPSHPKLPT